MSIVSLRIVEGMHTQILTLTFSYSILQLGTGSSGWRRWRWSSRMPETRLSYSSSGKLKDARDTAELLEFK